MGSLEAKRALITGASSGIGRAIALLFAREGGRLALLDRDAERGAALAAEIATEGGFAFFLAGDVSRAADVGRAVAAAVESLGGLDVLVNAAGVVSRRSVVELEEEEWDRVMAINAKSVYLTARFAIPHLERSTAPSIVNVASGWGLAGGPRAAVYCASKGAVVLLTKSMAIDCGPLGIRVNCLCPGDTDTPMLREEARQLGEDEAAFLADAARRPLGRPGRAEEIAQAALFLASEASSFVTGTTLVVDGGGLTGS